MSDTTDYLTDAGQAAEPAQSAAPAAETRPRRRAAGLTGMLLPELQGLASSLGISGTGRMRKGELVAAIQAKQGGGGHAQLPLAAAGVPVGGPAGAGGPPDPPAPAGAPAAAAPARPPGCVTPGGGSAGSADAPAASTPAAGVPSAGTGYADAPAASTALVGVPSAGAGSSGAPSASTSSVGAPAASVSSAGTSPATAPAADGTDRPVRTRQRRGASRPAGSPDSAPTADATAAGAVPATAASAAVEAPAAAAATTPLDTAPTVIGTTSPQVGDPSAPERIERPRRERTPRGDRRPDRGDRADSSAEGRTDGDADAIRTDDRPPRRDRTDGDADGGRTDGDRVARRAEGDGDRNDGRRDRTDRAEGDGDRNDGDRGPRRERADGDQGERPRRDRNTDQGDGDQGDRNDRRRERNTDQRAASDRPNNRNDNRGGNDNRAENRTDNRGGGSDRGPDRGGANTAVDDDDDFDGRGGSRRRGRFRDRNRRGRTPGGERFAGDPAEPIITDDDVLLPVAGILDILDNYAFVRTSGYLTGPNDVYVSLAQVRRHGLRRGDAVTGAVKQPRDGERKDKYNALVRLDTVNGVDPEQARNRPEFMKLTPLYPQDRLRLETEPHLLTPRVIDLVMPIGKGQRALIVSPPKAGKTMIMQAIANAVTTNNPECHLMVVLVDERPEEVTDMQRAVKGEVIASTFDRPPTDHTTVAELSIERAKRLVELGHDVVVLLDNITRLGRAYNLAAPASGRILSGGVDSTALYPPKRFLGAARNIENGGSLTILATALIETGSTMDTVIFEEFKGTGNAELILSRKIANKRVFPAVDVIASGTRKEEILLAPDELAIVHKLRRVLNALDPESAIELLLDRLKQSRTNIEFLMQIAKSAPGD